MSSKDLVAVIVYFSGISPLLLTNSLSQFTQQSLAEASGVTLSTVKRMENGEIGAFSSLIRVLRVLGLLDYIQPLTEEEQLSPQEYYDLMHSAQKKSRKRAIGKLKIKDKEDTEW